MVALGALYLDIVCKRFPFDDALWPEQEVVGDNYDVVPGGSATNFACTSSSLGMDVTLMGKIGDDFPGDTLATMLQQWGVGFEPVRSASHQTNLGISFNGTHGPIMTAAGSANQTMSPDEVVPAFLAAAQHADYAYFGGCLKLVELLPALPELARELRNSGVTVVVDHGRVYNTITEDTCRHARELCKQADLYFPSTDELLALWGTGTVEAAIQAVRGPRNITVAVKGGRTGATCFIDDTTHTRPAHDVPVVHHVGAGDAFNAGFVSAHAAGGSAEESLFYASATAAMKISGTGYPSKADVDAFAARAR